MAYITDLFGSQIYFITVIQQLHMLYSKLFQTKIFFLQISQKQSVANKNELMDLVVNIECQHCSLFLKEELVFKCEVKHVAYQCYFTTKKFT